MDFSCTQNFSHEREAKTLISKFWSKLMACELYCVKWFSKICVSQGGALFSEATFLESNIFHTTSTSSFGRVNVNDSNSVSWSSSLPWRTTSWSHTLISADSSTSTLLLLFYFFSWKSLEKVVLVNVLAFLIDENIEYKKFKCSINIGNTGYNATCQRMQYSQDFQDYP